jgi:hypothetical protein
MHKISILRNLDYRASGLFAAQLFPCPGAFGGNGVSCRAPHQPHKRPPFRLSQAAGTVQGHVIRQAILLSKSVLTYSAGRAAQLPRCSQWQYMYGNRGLASNFSINDIHAGLDAFKCFVGSEPLTDAFR